MSLPDNRIRFPSTLVNFSTDVGVTGLTHDEYPQAGSQARFDHLRLYLIGLLSNQSSYVEPTNYRNGTVWFDLNTLSLKIRRNDSWTDISEAIQVNGVDLQTWQASADLALSSLSPEISFQGIINADTTEYITIPTSVAGYIFTDSRAFITINGENPPSHIVNPQNALIQGSPPSFIQLTTLTLNKGDTFHVSIRRVSTETFIQETITVV